MTVPMWADSKLSADLPDIRFKGESANTEFKEMFPEQARKLAKELAALGTCGGGRLFLGVNDNGDLVGLPAHNGDERDDVIERAHGIVQTVRPPLVVKLDFAVESGKTVLVFDVPSQAEPIFYSDNIPYIRDGRHSRPATPDEVKERVWSHPSAEFKREEERLKILQKQDHHERMKRIGDNTDRLLL